MKELLLITIIAIGIMGCKPLPQNATMQEIAAVSNVKYSLAQWSFHRALFAGEMNNFDFVREASKMGFDGVEFVSQFFQDKVEDADFLDSLGTTLQLYDLAPVMIMVDLAGNIGTSDSTARKAAVATHKKWIKASHRIGCSYTRVNAHGDGSREEYLAACTESVTELAAYAAKYNITILIENHGSYSSDADWLVQLITDSKTPNVKALADFDNWCIERENGDLWGAPCIKSYDKYEGMDKLLPHAAGVSLKAFEFDVDGNAIRTDFSKMMPLITKHNYKGYLGVEYEGDQLPARTGILKTKALAAKLLGH